MPGVLTGGSSFTIEEAIEGRSRAMIDEGCAPLYIKICGNTVRRLSKAQGWTRLSDITYESVSAALYELRAAGRTKKTRDNTLSVLSELMEWACKQKDSGVTENPCRLIERVHKRGEIETDATRALTWEQSETLENVARVKEERNISIGRSSARRADLIRVLRYTGRRVGEWVPTTVDRVKEDAIRVRDIRFNDQPYPVYVVRREVNKSRKKLILPIHPAIVGTLRAICAGKHPEDYVFETQPATETLSGDLEDAGIEKLTHEGSASLHSLRKTFNTTLARMGVPLLERKILMGHGLHTDLTDGTYLGASQIDIYAALCKLPWDGAPKEKIAQENLTPSPTLPDTEGVLSHTPHAHTTHAPVAAGTAHSAAKGRGSLARAGGRTCAMPGRSFGGPGGPSSERCSRMPPEGLEPSGGSEGGIGAQGGAQERPIPGREARLQRLTAALADATETVSEAANSHHPDRIQQMKTAARAASAIAALIATVAGASTIAPPRPSALVIDAKLRHVEGLTAAEFRGYGNGLECYFGSPAHTQPSVALCVKECDKNCPQWLTDCAHFCSNPPPPDDMIRAVSRASLWIVECVDEAHAGHTEQGKSASEVVPGFDLAIKIIEVGMNHPDPVVQVVATAIAHETPFMIVN